MAQKVYALLVGINDYAPEVGKLGGCLNDVDYFHDYLKSSCSNLAAVVLKDSEATRDNIIKQFRTHLRQAKAGDVALFQYCGHGARWAAAKEFKQYYPDGWDEGIVCYDSRRQNGNYPYDLADKELAILVEEVAANNPHLAVILDCCHSGSGTRDVDAFRNLRPRQTHEVKNERPLESYLDGYYNKQKVIPTSKHILLAACERTQKAQEDPRQHRGVFTSTLLEVLEKNNSHLSYADLFVQCRSTVRKRADNQVPQFESYKNFNAYSGFLGRDLGQSMRRHFLVEFKSQSNAWEVEAGALHGLPTEPEKSVGLALYTANDRTHAVGNATTTQVGAQKSVVNLDFTGDPATKYFAEVTSLPVAPLQIFLSGEDSGKEALRKALQKDQSCGAAFTDTAEGARYEVAAEDGKFLLMQRELNFLIQGVQGLMMQERSLEQYSEDSARAMLGVVKQVVQWERGLALQNHGTRMDTAKVDFFYAETLANGKERVYSGEDVTLDFVKDDIHGKMKLRNGTQQKLHYVLCYFSEAYGIHLLREDEIIPGPQEVTIWGEEADDYFHLEDEVNASLENFKLILSTEKVDGFLLAQEGLELGQILATQRAVGNVKPSKKYENEWFTKSMRVKVVRQLNQVGEKDAALAQGQIVVKKHPKLKANLSMSAAKSKTPTRGVGAMPDFYKAFEREGMELFNFAAGTRGESESVLELSDIQNLEALKDAPLEIEMNVPLANDEAILPIVFDGEHAMLGGDVSKDEHGNTHISISEIPAMPDTQRSVGRALKMYFIKTYLKQDNVNMLRWVEFKPDGKFEQHKTFLADKVSAAQNILLVIHGIIGNTETILKELVIGTKLQEKFDLVLSFDYENLSTAISDTGLDLKKKLEAAGIGDNDNKKLTVLAHSMGGLVSRWFIEREAGNRMVDHLVMCGTPNNGSPFGKVELVRKLINTLTVLTMNYFPALIPFNGAIMLALNRSKKITPTLEQMDAASEFIKNLNSSGDPGVRYTMLAGNVEEYNDPSDHGFAKLLAKTGKSVLFTAMFGNSAHDIAASVDSVLGIDAARNPMPKRMNVPCHHLNYFFSEVGQKALNGVEW